MTAAIYRAANSSEVVTIRARAPPAPGAATNEGICRMIPAQAQPASREARMYFQIAESIGATPNCIGLPAYQNAGMTRSQEEAVQASAIPTGPHGSPKKNI